MFRHIVIIATFFIINKANAQWPVLYDYAGYDDEARAIAIDSENYVAIAGYVNNSGGLRGRAVIRYNNIGQQMWSSILWSAGNSKLDAIATLSNDDIVVAGTAYPSTNEDIYVVYYDKNNNTPQWERTYDGGEADHGKGIAVDINDNIVVAGYSFLTTGDIYLIKYNSSGTVIWEKRHDLGGFETPEDVAVDYTGNIIICGEKINSNLDYLIIKCNPSGDILWTKEFDGGGIDYAHGIITDSQNNIIVTGRRNNGTNYDYWTIKLSPSGAILWQDVHDTGYNDLAHDVCVDICDSIVVAGSSFNTASGFFNHFIIKYASNGTIGRTIRDNVDTDEMGNGVVLSPSGNGFVTGYLDVPTRGFDIYTVRYVGLGHGTQGIKEEATKKIKISNILMNVRLISRNSFSINLYLPKNTDIRLEVLDVLGRPVVILKRGRFKEGWHSVQWNGSNNSGDPLGSGVYYCRLKAGDYSETQKLLLIK